MERRTTDMERHYKDAFEKLKAKTTSFGIHDVIYEMSQASGKTESDVIDYLRTR